MKDFKLIEGKDNSLIKLISALQNSSKKRREYGLFVIEGLRICKDAYENGIRFDNLIVSMTALEKYQDDIAVFSKNCDECVKIPDTLFNRISDTETPQGIIALSKIPETSIQGISKKGRYVALENISDPANLGAISRTAEALGVSGLIISKGGCDPFSPKALRASMGTLLRMPIVILNNFAKDIKKTELNTYACVVDNTAESIKDVNFADGSVIIIGNEANGITAETRQSASKHINIRMKGTAEALNAAAAAAISIWEMMK